MLADLRYAIRTFAKSPWVTLVIVLSLALGIGSNTVIFSWLRTVALHPLPAITTEPFALEARNPAGTYIGSSWLEYRDLRELLPSYSAVFAHRPRSLYLGDGEGDERIWAELVSEDFFSGLGVTPALGRFFRSDETTRPGSEPVAIIGYDFWHRKYSADPGVLGRELRLNNRVFTIVGVAPPRFKGAYNALGFDLWVPLTMVTELQPSTAELRLRPSRGYAILGTLKPGVSAAQAAAELAAAGQALAADQPDTNAGVVFDLLPLWRSPRGGTILTASLATLQAFAALILIMVCANTATLLLARASVRQREIGIRLAIGAGVRRVIFQLLSESVLVALAGAALGLIFALWGLDAVRSMPLPTSVPIRLEPHLEWTSLLFAVGLATVCGILFGLAPALQLARSDVNAALRNSRGVAGGRSRVRDFLVASEVAVALVILVLAGLFLKSFRHSQRLYPGFTADGILLASVDLSGRGYDEVRSRRFIQDVVTRLAEVPAVTSAAAAGAMLLDIRGLPSSLVEVDSAPPEPGRPRQTSFMHASPGYFATLGIPLVAGTELKPLDRDGQPLDAVVNEEFLRRYWPGVSPSNPPATNSSDSTDPSGRGRSVLGRHFKLGSREYEVVGVARTGLYENLSERPRPMVWLTMRSQFTFGPTLHIRVRGGDPMAFLPDLRALVRSIDPELSLFDTRTLPQHLENNLFLHRVPAQMLAVFGPLALALAAIGLYAVLAYSLARRTPEIGIRLALGATPQSIVRLVMWDGLRVILPGIALGLTAALGCGYYFSRTLVNVPPADPLIFGGVSALLIAVATLACWLPARRSAHVDPMIALRAE